MKTKWINPTVYLVGHCGPEHDVLMAITFRKSKALKLFTELRMDLLEDNMERYVYWEKEGNSVGALEMYKDIIQSLKEPDPEKIDSYPHETPYIRTMRILW